MTNLIDQILHVPPLIAYILIAVLVFSEAAIFVGFVLPGETAVVLGGALASTGRVSLSAVLVIVVVSAVVGDSVGYEVGRKFGPRLLDLGPLSSHRHRLDGARRFLRERGGVAIFLGRFSAFLRAVIPALAGLSRMPYRRFLAWNAAGGVIWGVGVTLLGYFAGTSYAKVEHWLGQFSAIVLVVLVVLAVVVWRRRRSRDEREDHPTDLSAE